MNPPLRLNSSPNTSKKYYQLLKALKLMLNRVSPLQMMEKMH